MHGWMPVSLRHRFHPSPLCLVSSYPTLQEKSVWEARNGEWTLIFQYLTPQSCPCSLPTDRAGKDTHSGKSPVVVIHRAERKHKGHTHKDHLGSCWKMHITRLEYSSVVQHLPIMHEVLSSIPSMGRGERESPIPVPKDLNQLMMCLHSIVCKSLHFRPNIEKKSACYLSPVGLKN